MDKNATLVMNVSECNGGCNAFPPGYGPPTGFELVMNPVLHLLDSYYTPSMVGIGIPLNIIAIYVLVFTELRKLSVCSFFVALCAVDLTYLSTMIIPWLSRRGLDLYNMEGFCQLVLYATQLSLFLVSWYMVLVMLDRVLHGHSGDRHKSICTNLWAKFTIVAIAVVGIVAFLYVTWTSAALRYGGMKMCTIIPENAYAIQELRKADVIVSLVIPWVMIFILDIFAIVLLCTRKGRIAAKGACLKNRYRQSEHVISNGAQLTVTSIAVSIVFELLFLPVIVIKTKQNYISTHSGKEVTLLRLFEHVSTLEFTINFFIFLISMPEFRKGLANIFLGKCFRSQRLQETITISVQ